MKWPMACIRCVFAQTDAAVEEQRVIRHARLFGDGQRGGMRKPI